MKKILLSLLLLSFIITSCVKEPIVVTDTGIDYIEFKTNSTATVSIEHKKMKDGKIFDEYYKIDTVVNTIKIPINTSYLSENSSLVYIIVSNIDVIVNFVIKDEVLYQDTIKTIIFNYDSRGKLFTVK